jgi:hypothetical protein
MPYTGDSLTTDLSQDSRRPFEMRRLRLKHEYILLAASLAFAAVDLALRGYSFAADAAFSVSFTVLVFAYAIRKRGLLLFRGEQARPLPEIVLAHIVCVATLVLVLRTGMFASTMPGWLTLPIVADHYERLGPSSFQMLQALVGFFLGYCEWRILTSPRTINPEREERKARTALWKKAELDAQRMNSLRLP